MKNLTFKVSTEIKNILGRDLITNSNVAILELVKNSYDAHASNVRITFDDDVITILDDGKGMSHEDIINKWLFLGYSAKRDGTEDGDYRHNQRRLFAGAKGIGRMSCDRLSRHLTLTTFTNNSTHAEVLEINWDEFENKQSQEFNAISVQCRTENLGDQFPNSYASGTKLELSVLRDRWDRDSIMRLRKSLERMINPMSSIGEFSINIVVPCLQEEDENLRNEVFYLRNSSEQLSDSQLKRIAEKERRIVNGLICNTITSVLELKTTKIQSRLHNGIITTSLTDRGNLMYEISEPSLHHDLEDISISIFFLNRAAKYNFSALMGLTASNYGNLFLFRNGFRVLPYGESNDDSWGINKRAQQGFRRHIGTRDILGQVNILTGDVETFKEVSSRDGGLIQNDSTKQLYEFTLKTFTRLERYVVGVLWGESFLRNEYFKDRETAKNYRKEFDIRQK